MNILITGASGFVGRALANKLKGNKLFLITRDKGFAFPGSTVLCGDISDFEFSKKALENIDTVYYLAGYKKNIAFHTKTPLDFIAGNVEPLISFLRALKDSNVKKMVYMSSVNVSLFKEGEEDGYVVGKYINELILKSFIKETGIDVKIVRSPGIYGPGDNFNPETANFIPSMIQKVFESKDEIAVWGSGKREIQFIFIDDLVASLVAIMNGDKKFYTIGNDEVLTINQIAEKIIELSGKQMTIKNDVSKPDKPSFLFEFESVIGEMNSFENGLKKTIEYYKNLHV